ncbi:MAG: hypothetical protein Q7S59_10465 [Sulfurimonas sp.]|nr:hypothetical protein [Sulfurimonas sp.]
MKNTEIIGYQNKLSDLLDTCVFFQDIEAPITREIFEKKFNKMVRDAFELVALDLHENHLGVTLDFKDSKVKNESESTFITLAEPKGLYVSDAAEDYEAIKVHFILQCKQTGKVFIHNKEYGTSELNFEFVGSKKELYKYILKEKEKLAFKVSDLKLK